MRQGEPVKCGPQHTGQDYRGAKGDGSVHVLKDIQGDTGERVDDAIVVLALGTMHENGGGHFLFFVNPLLQAELVDPFSSATTHTRRSPVLIRFVFVCTKAYPTLLPKKQRVKA